MTFYLLVENLFIREGIRSILADKYNGSSIVFLEKKVALSNQITTDNGFLISNETDLFLNNASKILNLVLQRQLKTILIANIYQIDLFQFKELENLDAVIHSDCSFSELNEALSHLMAGLKYRCKMMNQLDYNSGGFENLLFRNNVSYREYQIIKLIIKGMKSMEIASDLNISYNTVTTHRKNINRKLNLSQSNDLFRLYLNFHNHSKFQD